MEKRDLKADLELCKQLKSDWEKVGNRPWLTEELYVDFAHAAREGWPHAIERALKAEALARELVAALRRISEILDNATCRCRCGFCEYFNAQKRADKALAKAKEVLGDE